MVNPNEKHIGLWIDHEKVLIVKLINGNVTLKSLRSEVLDHRQLSGRPRLEAPYGSQDISAERRIEERYRNRLHKYYKRIIHEIEDADKIFIFGPGEARIELKKEMKRSKERFIKIRGVERADRMTEAQIIAKVKAFFHND